MSATCRWTWPIFAPSAIGTSSGSPETKSPKRESRSSGSRPERTLPSASSAPGRPSGDDQSAALGGLERQLDAVAVRVQQVGRLRHNVVGGRVGDRKSTRLNSSHANISYAVFCLKK